jgi:hypothetical protein
MNHILSAGAAGEFASASSQGFLTCRFHRFIGALNAAAMKSEGSAAMAAINALDMRLTSPPLGL